MRVSGSPPTMENGTEQHVEHDMDSSEYIEFKSSICSGVILLLLGNAYILVGTEPTP